MHFAIGFLMISTSPPRSSRPCRPGQGPWGSLFMSAWSNPSIVLSDHLSSSKFAKELFHCFLNFHRRSSSGCVLHLLLQSGGGDASRPIAKIPCTWRPLRSTRNHRPGHRHNCPSISPSPVVTLSHRINLSRPGGLNSLSSWVKWLEPHHYKKNVAPNGRYPWIRTQNRGQDKCQRRRDWMR